MTWPQAVVVWWIQFALAAAVLLLLARGALRWIGQPVERIRLIQLALAAVLAAAVLLVAAPWPAWRMGLISPDAPATLAKSSEPLPPEIAAPGSTEAQGAPAAAFASGAALDRRPVVLPDEPPRSSLPVAAAPATHSAPAREIAVFDAPPDRGQEKIDFWLAAAVVLFAAHAIAAIYFLVEGIVGALRLRSLCRSASAANDIVRNDWLALTAGRGRRVRLLVSAAVETPLTFGWLRPVVVVPRELAAAPNAALRSCLAHEWSHIERGDMAWWRFAWVCQFLLWHQPLFWGLWSELRICQDMLADADSTRAGQDSIEYSELLVRFAGKRLAPSLGGALTFVDRPSHLTRRITMLLQTKAPLRSRCTWRFSLGSLLLAASAAVAISAVRLDSTQADDAQEEKKQPAARAPAEDQPAEAPQRREQDANEKTALRVQRELDEVANDEIAGRVVDENGAPLPDVTVDAWHWHPGNETKTDENGLFRLKGLDPKDRVEVLVAKEGYSPQHFPQRPPGAKGWVVTLDRKTYFEGTILDTEGKPVAGAEIRASFGPVEGDGVVISEVPIQGKSREDGTYRLYVPPRVFDFQVSAGERGVFRRSNVALQQGEAKSLPVRLQPGVRFEAKVVDSITGEPVEGFVLWRWRAPRFVTRSDAQGKIVLEGLIPGKTEFSCGGGEEIVHSSGVRFFQHGPFGRWWSADALHEWQRYHIDDQQSGWQRNFDDLEFDLHVGMEPVTIVVEQGVTVTGRVTDPKGNPVAGATVAPAKTGSGNSITGDTRYSVATDKDGNYRVVLPASNQAVYNLVAHDGGYREWRNWANGVSEPMQTKPGQKIEGLNLQLTEPATIRGRVLLGGKGVGGRDVRAHAFDKLENRYYDPTTQTREDGAFELKFIRPGKHYVQVEPFWLTAEQAPQGSQEVELKAGEVLEGIELHAAPERTEVTPEVASLPIEARVLDAQQQPVANVPVALGVLGGIKSYLGALEQQYAGLAQETQTNEKGRAPLGASVMAQFRQSASLVYAVDREGGRAGIALLNLTDYADANPLEGDPVIDVVLEPAVQVRIEVGAAAFKDLHVKPEAIYLAITRDSLPLQQSAMTQPGARELLLPAGAYKAAVYSTGMAEMSEAEFQLDAEKKLHELKIELQPSRLAKLIGQPAPEFQSIKPSGEDKPLRLADLQGKVVVLDFWGYWCGPCIAAMPNLMDLYNEFRDRGVEVIAMHDDSVGSVEELNATIAKLQAEQWNGREIPFSVLLDGGGETPIPGSTLKARGATTAAYGITAFPTTLVIDRQGRIEGQINLHDPESARQRLEELLRRSGQ